MTAGKAGESTGSFSSVIEEQFGWSQKTCEKPSLRKAVAELDDAADTNTVDSGSTANLSLSAKELAVLADRMSIPESYFYRDPKSMRALQDSVMPELARENAGVIKIWSAGCAHGEEAYTLSAICGKLGLQQRVEIVGTDLSRANIDAARIGKYSLAAVRNSEPVEMEIVLPTATGYRVANGVQERVRFEQMNLLDSTTGGFEQGTIDLVLCRNVLIYMNDSAIAQIARTIHRSLRVGGYCLLAPADPDIAQYAPFKRVKLGDRFFVQKVDQVPSRPSKNQLTKKTQTRSPVRKQRVPAMRAQTPAEPSRIVKRRRDDDPTPNIAVQPPEPRFPTPDSVGTSKVADGGSSAAGGALMGEGIAALDGGDIGSAVTAFRAVACIQPTSPYAHRMLAVAYLAAGQGPRAAASIRRARDLVGGMGAGDCVAGFGDMPASEVLADLDGIASLVVGDRGDS
ncbi:MAG: methyltransferase domain-containing protein [Actinobacteria bacterium]|nr:methyltransferase domain-containing protein [Actinomycetota bacterium]